MRRRKKWAFPLLSAAVIAVMAGFIWFFYKGRREPAPLYQTVRVEKGDIASYVSATGTINPVDLVELGTQISGTIVEILVDYNAKVKKGDLLARLDPTLFQSQVDQSMASVNAARANLNRARVTLKNDELHYQRQKELFDLNLNSQSDRDNVQAAYEQSLANIHSLQAEINQWEALHQQHLYNLSLTRIFAPTDGIVIARNISVGQTVVASLQSPVLFKIAHDLTMMQINTDVAESDIGRVREGAAAEFTVYAFPEKVFFGNVAQVRLDPVVISNVVNYNALIDVDNTGLLLKPGMTATVSILAEEKKEVIKVLHKALRFFMPGQEEDRQRNMMRNLHPGEGTVWILGKDRQPRLVVIKTGIGNDEYIEVLEGVRPGDEVIVGMM